MLFVIGYATNHLLETAFWWINFAIYVIVISVRLCNIEMNLVRQLLSILIIKINFCFIRLPVNKAEITIILIFSHCVHVVVYHYLHLNISVPRPLEPSEGTSVHVDAILVAWGEQFTGLTFQGQLYLIEAFCRDFILKALILQNWRIVQCVHRGHPQLIHRDFTVIQHSWQRDDFVKGWLISHQWSFGGWWPSSAWG